MSIKARTIVVLLALAFLIGLASLAGCGSPGPTPNESPVQTPATGTSTPTPSPTPTPLATETPVVPTPTLTPTPYVTSTPIPASEMRGEWHRITTADGLCTDWPIFIGVWYIGTGTTTVCYAAGTGPAVGNTWLTRTVPLGTRVTAIGKFPPGGGELYATDAGVCGYDGYDWECQTAAEGYPHEDIQRIDHIAVDPVLMLSDAIVYRDQTYSIPEIVGIGDARPTWVSVSGEMYGYGPVPEIWVGTNGYGIIAIRPDTEGIVHYTTADGLPSNAIRQINTAGEDYHYNYRSVWVATDNGVGHWDGQRWTAYTVADGLPSNDVRGVGSGGGQTGNVWVATGRGVAYSDGQSWRALTHEDGLPEGDLSGVMVWLNEIWFSTRGSGLLVFVIQPPAR